MNEKCAVCQKEIAPNTNFCSNCGAKVDNSNAEFTLGYKLKIIFVSLLLSPFGLVYFFKFFRSTSNDKRNWAYIALVITIISTSLSIMLVSSYIKAVSSYTDVYSSMYGI